MIISLFLALTFLITSSCSSFRKEYNYSQEPADTGTFPIREVPDRIHY